MGVTVLCASGGLDSTLIALQRERKGLKTKLVFADYGQSYLAEERRALLMLMKQTRGCSLHEVTLSPLKQRLGVFEDRNEKIVRAAVRCLEDLGADVERVLLGIRCPLARFDRYGDSNLEWAHRLSRDVRIPISCPLGCWPRWAVRLGVRMLWKGDGRPFSSHGYVCEEAK